MPIQRADRPGFELGRAEIIPFDGGGTELVKGRQIFNFVGLTDLNRSPINKLLSFITDGVKLTGGFKDDDEITEVSKFEEGDKPPFGAHELSESLLVDGSVFAIDSSLTETLWGQSGLQLKNDVRLFTNSLASEKFVDKNDLKIIREYKKITPDDMADKNRREQIKFFEKAEAKKEIADGEPFWLVTDFIDKGSGELGLIKKQIRVPINMIYIFMNGQGLLFEVQLMFRRLEEIKEAIRDKTTGNSIDLAVIGHIGDPAAAAQVFASGVQMVNIPQQAGSVQMERIGKSEVVNQLSSEFVQLKSDYLEALNTMTTNDAVPISGTARKLLMSPMLKQVERTRKHMKTIYNTYDWTIDFNTLTVLSVDERLKEMDLIDRLLETEAIDSVREKVLRMNLI